MVQRGWTRNSLGVKADQMGLWKEIQDDVQEFGLSY